MARLPGVTASFLPGNTDFTARAIACLSDALMIVAINGEIHSERPGVVGSRATIAFRMASAWGLAELKTAERISALAIHCCAREPRALPARASRDSPSE